MVLDRGDEHEGAQVEVLPVDRDGRVQPDTLAAALSRTEWSKSPPQVINRSSGPGVGP